MATSDEREESAARRLRIFVAFEGGGAKGVAHIGALKELERPEFEIKGFSGTSAGAIVATLAAAGFTADELFDFREKTSLLDWLVGKGSTDVEVATDFFAGRWSRVRLLRTALSTFNGRGGYLPLLTQFNIALLGILVVVLLWAVPGAATIGGLVVVAVAFVAFIVLRHVLRGLVRLKVFRRAMNDALCFKLGFDRSHVVTFGDLRGAGRPSLKIVSADLGARSLRLFSTEHLRDRNTPVADAVAASVCLPIVFVPWPMLGTRFVDGGLVSNLPVWPFDEERALDPDAKTIAVEIEDKPIVPVPRRERNWLVDIVRTAIFGAGVLNTRAVDGLHIVRLRTDLDLLDFDVGKDRLADEIEKAASQASLQIRSRILDGPVLVRETNQQVLELVAGLLTREGKPQRVRVAIARPDGGFTRSLRLRHCVGFDEFCDENLLLPIDRSVVGEAWRTRAALLEEDPQASEDWLSAETDRWVRKRFAKDIKWILTIPIFNATSGTDDPQRDPTPSFVVTIDGNGASPGDGDDAEQAFPELVEAIASAYIPLLQVMEDLEDV